MIVISEIDGRETAWECRDFETVTKLLAAKKWLFWEIERVFSSLLSKCLGSAGPTIKKPN